MNTYLLIGRETEKSYLVKAFTSDRAISILADRFGETASCWFICGFSPLPKNCITVN